jgi:hypothetical protein
MLIRPEKKNAANWQMCSDDARHARLAFLEKRDAQFSGR